MPSKFQIEPQQKLNWCWAAVTATVSRYFSPQSNISQCNIAQRVLKIDCSNPDSDRPARFEDALSVLNEILPQPLNNKPLEQQSLPFETIQSQIHSGRPVCARIGWFNEDSGHLVMITGYSVSNSGEQWLDISDPYYEDSTVPYVDFKNAYLAAGEWTDTYLLGQP